MKIAYLGPEGTFTEAALWKLAERQDFVDVRAIPMRSPREAVDAVRAGEAEYACVAIENSVDGAVTPTFDALAVADNVQIFEEIDLPIAFAIMSLEGTDPATAQTIATHPVAYQQVKGWLARHAPQAEFVAATSNAAAAQLVAEGKADLAAAPLRAAEVYGLSVISDNVADVAGARTRFVLIGQPARSTPRTGTDRTAIMFILKNEPGSLVAALSEFALRGVDLSRIESRPIESGLGYYRFHVDVNGHIDDAPVAEALRALYLRCSVLQFLGSWPAHQANPREVALAADTELIDQAARWVNSIREGRL
ncbi:MULTISPECIES: prephenate dehydratase [Corynebacterium]|uniref:Prephenate dehydratase n=1 Tax=Corynebacterium ramonii TaxID=3026968 RepID=A0ABN4EK26_9CORY|nr:MULTISPECIES: prephenate dehydratase [Corynebacterium]AIU33631.1 Prephenate dehydratase [Corynebacterium ramonii FRC0011]ESU57413.1 prephenate dehydratase [Corynebacterium ulcerans NCTC 12077]STC81176.1 Prephenate dehydratase [Corynebacterium ulcerans]